MNPASKHAFSIPIDMPDCPKDLETIAPQFDAHAHWPILYKELHRIAERLMAQERSGHTLSATALVHEAWLNLSAGNSPASAIDRTHFLSLSARAMRHILVNHANARNAEKRLGEIFLVTLSAAEVCASVQQGPEELLALDQALTTLAKEDARAAQVAELKVFAGLLIPEIAEALAISEPTVKRDWVFARARLAQLIQ
ncbi:ECF-type sigma factor [Undibacterium sp. Ji22W]|uniref:ECF-type sigma factor n=1 Tax=Undibacterium sp. Ji22W TaxID=3413038 RepID=UPI003BEFEC4B